MTLNTTDDSDAGANGQDHARLRVSLANDLTPPSTAHELLVAFHFGPTPAQLEHPAVVSPSIHAIDKDELYETWWIDDKVEYYTHGSMRIAECTDYAVVIYENDERDYDDHESFVHQAYVELLEAVAATRHPRLVKVWNYLGGINDGHGDLERYRQFSVGRAIAFGESGVGNEDAPTGTGVGTTGDRGMSIIALCSNRDFALAENPRQVSAFHYPREYGPRTPKFGRGGAVAASDHHLHLISGTASIVGHESMHLGDTVLQLDETLRNLDSLCDAISEVTREDPKFVLDDQSVLRVYLRNPGDYLPIASRLKDYLGPGADQVAFLHGHICRRELLVEIDGVRVQ